MFSHLFGSTPITPHLGGVVPCASCKKHGGFQLNSDLVHHQGEQRWCYVGACNMLFKPPTLVPCVYRSRIHLKHAKKIEVTYEKTHALIFQSGEWSYFLSQNDPISQIEPEETIRIL